MPLIEAALAFAITMLALSLIVSSFVEIIHRTFKMREKGLKYMLEQLFDHVLVKYADPILKKVDAQAVVARDAARNALAAELAKTAPDEITVKTLKAALTTAEAALKGAYDSARESFVEQMRANRVPVGLQAKNASSLWNPGRMWGGLHVTALTPTDFMDRLGSQELGDAIKGATDKAKAGSVADGAAAVGSAVDKIVGIDPAEIKKAAAGKTPEEAAAAVFRDITGKLANIDLKKQISDAAVAAGKGAAETVDTVLTDIAQKFDGFGKDAAVYFEGRARFMSVAVAIVLAFAVHVDAVDLFRTYFKDPNARAKVIEQATAITAQYQAAQKNIEALKAVSPPPAETDDATKAQVEKLKKDTLDAIDKTNETVKSFAGLGAPLGWTDDRWSKAGMYELVWTCKKVKGDIMPAQWKLGRECEIIQPSEEKGKPKPAVRDKLERGVDYSVWFGIPSDLSVILYLLLGGLLIGLGSPFWYDAVIGLTNIRSMASGTSGPTQPQKAAPLAPHPADTDKAQPVTPAGAFKVSNAASGVTK